MLEKEIEKILVAEIARVGGRAYKFVSPGNDGVPDRVVCLPNEKTYFVELKTASGKLTNLQKVQIERLRDLNQKVFVLKGLDGVAEFFRMLDRNDIAGRLKKRAERVGK